MALLIRNGQIVTVGVRAHGDIYVENETITRIGKNLEAPPGAEIIDATGKLVFPGFIDPHVHIYLPFMATFAKDTHETASKAALDFTRSALWLKRAFAASTRQLPSRVFRPSRHGQRSGRFPRPIPSVCTAGRAFLRSCMCTGDRSVRSDSSQWSKSVGVNRRFRVSTLHLVALTHQSSLLVSLPK